jgi:hypothetical protein
MEFMNRSSRPSQTSAPVGSSTNVNGGGTHRGRKSLKDWGTLQLLSVGLLFAGTILVVAVVWTLVLGSPNKEASYVDGKKMQAVFLNGGQVYFGNIRDLNATHVRLGNIYYLRVNQQVQPDAKAADSSSNDISLVKLGCELHGPQDEMLINREQVVFWENLKTDGQVAKAVAEYVKQNPNGQNCDTAQTQSTTPTTDATKK